MLKTMNITLLLVQCYLIVAAAHNSTLLPCPRGSYRWGVNDVLTNKVCSNHITKWLYLSYSTWYDNMCTYLIYLNTKGIKKMNTQRRIFCCEVISHVITSYIIVTPLPQRCSSPCLWAMPKRLLWFHQWSNKCTLYSTLSNRNVQR